MASDFQRRKITHVFAAMDADGDGRLTEADFVALADRWVGLGADRGQADAVLAGWWAALNAGGDQVSVDGVLAVVDRLGEMEAAVVATAHTVFDATDTDRDSAISGAEYRVLIEGWTGRSTATDEVFAVLDVDGDGTISRDEFTAHWLEFWAGDDPAAAGSLVFGRFG